MIDIGTRVRVKDNYTGGLDNVIGRTGRIVKSDDDSHLLDIKGERQPSWARQMWNYDVIVTSDEIELVDFNLTDPEGQKIEIGDTVVYGPVGGGITLGKVVDIDERDGWGSKTVKFRLEIQAASKYTDGGSREVNDKSATHYQWCQNPNQARVIKKGSSFEKQTSW